LQKNNTTDLKGLFTTLWLSKRIIFIITFLSTLLAIIYVLYKTPIYEAKALIEIGNYKIDTNNKSNDKVLLNNSTELIEKLHYIYIDAFKNVEDRKSKISALALTKKSKIFIEITAEGISNKLAKQEIQNLLKNIQTEDNAILKNVKSYREVEIANIEEKINNIKNQKVTIIEQKIEIEKKRRSELQNQILEINKIIKNLETEKPTLVALQIMQKNILINSIATINKNILDLQNKENNLSISQINSLIEKKKILELMLLPYNYKNSQIVGKILTNSYASKPKKSLIIAVAFVLGLILSIFVILFLEFVVSIKEDIK
jgi:LPS O-antigen subunit length determinant protein (WzzB/FepE family)